MPTAPKAETVAIAAAEDARHRRTRKASLNPIQRAAWRVQRWCDEADVGISTGWDVIAAKEVEVLRLGNITLILTSPIEWLRRKLEEQQASGTDRLPKMPRVRDMSPQEKAKANIQPAIRQRFAVVPNGGDSHSEAGAETAPQPVKRRGRGRPPGSRDRKPRRPRGAGLPQA